MSTVAASRFHADRTEGTIDPPPCISMDHLVNRLDAEVSAATQRVASLRAAAVKNFDKREERLTRYVQVADRMQEILLARLAGLTSLSVFKDIKQTSSPARQGNQQGGSYGRTTKLTIPYSDKRPAPMELFFRIDHDGAIENVVLDYGLQILPIFVKFDGHDQLIVHLEKLNDQIVAKWIDDRLVAFTKVYFEVYFSDEYQKAHLEIDPVMKVAFPKAFSTGMREYQKRTYYFYTEESLQRFEQNPRQYVE